MICNLNLVENEIHMVSVCPLYDQNRESLYRVALKLKESKNFYNLNNTNKFNWLMCNENKDICQSLAYFVYKSFRLRSDIEKKKNKFSPCLSLNIPI